MICRRGIKALLLLLLVVTAGAKLLYGGGGWIPNWALWLASAAELALAAALFSEYELHGLRFGIAFFAGTVILQIVGPSGGCGCLGSFDALLGRRGIVLLAATCGGLCIGLLLWRPRLHGTSPP